MAMTATATTPAQYPRVVRNGAEQHHSRGGMP